MSKITNEAGIPPVLFEAIKQNWYSGEKVEKDFSVTELLKPDRIVILQSRHKEEIVQEALDMVWAVFGSAVHSILEKGSKTKERFILEHRFTQEFLGKIISGQADIMDSKRKTLEDYKVTSAWKYVYRNKDGNATIEDWTYQLNMYRYFLKKEGFEIEELYVNLIFRDWQKSQANYNKDYPNQQIIAYPIKILSDEEIEAFLKHKISSLLELESVPDEELPVCSQMERWQDRDKFAVKKPKNKKASKICYTMKQAKAWIHKQKKPDAFIIEIRKGEPKRCKDYCPVASFCNWYQEWKRENE